MPKMSFGLLGGNGWGETMKKKEAEEILRKYKKEYQLEPIPENSVILSMGKHSEAWMARGFLDGYSQAIAKGERLAEALEKIRCQDSFECPDKPGVYTFLDSDGMVKIAEEALKEWEAGK